MQHTVKVLMLLCATKSGALESTVGRRAVTIEEIVPKSLLGVGHEVGDGAALSVLEQEKADLRAGELVLESVRSDPPLGQGASRHEDKVRRIAGVENDAGLVVVEEKLRIPFGEEGCVFSSLVDLA